MYYTSLFFYFLHSEIEIYFYVFKMHSKYMSVRIYSVCIGYVVIVMYLTFNITSINKYNCSLFLVYYLDDANTVFMLYSVMYHLNCYNIEKIDLIFSNLRSANFKFKIIITREWLYDHDLLLCSIVHQCCRNFVHVADCQFVLFSPLIAKYFLH